MIAGHRPSDLTRFAFDEGRIELRRSFIDGGDGRALIGPGRRRTEKQKYDQACQDRQPLHALFHRTPKLIAFTGATYHVKAMIEVKIERRPSVWLAASSLSVRSSSSGRAVQALDRHHDQRSGPHQIVAWVEKLPVLRRPGPKPLRPHREDHPRHRGESESSCSFREFTRPREATIPWPLCISQSLPFLKDVTDGVLAHHYRIQSLKGTVRLAV